MTAIVLALPLDYKHALNKVANHEHWRWNRHYTDFTLARRHYRPLPQELAGLRLLRLQLRLDSISRELEKDFYLKDHSVVLDLRTQRIPATVQYFVGAPTQDTGAANSSTSPAPVTSEAAGTAATTTATSSTEELKAFLRDWLAKQG